MAFDEFGEAFDEYDDAFIFHYGTPQMYDGDPHGSGRYRQGSGKNPYQHEDYTLTKRVEELRKSGMKDTQICEVLGFVNPRTGKPSTSVLRDKTAVAKARIFEEQYAIATRMRDEGATYQEIADRLGLSSDSNVRYLLGSDYDKRTKVLRIARELRNLVDEKGAIDVGRGVEHELHITQESLDKSLEALRQEGYEVYSIGLSQLTNPGRQTPLKIVCPPGTTYADAYKLRDAGDIHSVVDYTVSDGEGGIRKPVVLPPESVSSDRVYVRYAEEGGTAKDGLIELRPGVADLNLGASTYAQVRIAVDGTHYLKGMAVYGDPKDFPNGCDIIFNSNKSKTVPKMDAMKELKKDPNNPFGALIKEDGQSFYTGADGKQHLSPINKIREEGEWNQWEKSLPHQFLAKQSVALIKQQLTAAYVDHQTEFDEISALTNPIVKRHFLLEFADQCDSDAIHMKGASLPGQKWKVLLPTTELKDNEVYDPTHKNGEQVALIRFPHQGTFEIPICTVNNKNPKLKAMLGNVEDACAINKNVADRLSGADFDGDTVIVVPVGNNPATRITSRPQLDGLNGFDPKAEYATVKRPTGKTDADGNEVYEYIGKNGKPIKPMKHETTQNEMGRITNLITDMTIQGASDDELVRAVRHALVVIDAEKHKLDYQASFRDNNIAALKRDYQGRTDSDGNYTEGAATIFSRAKSDVHVPETRGNPHIDPKTGQLDWTGKQTGRTYVNDKGETVLATKKITQMENTTDAHTLSLGFPKEEIYADYANHLKSLANQARKLYMETPRPRQDKDAAQEYSDEVASLKRAVRLAELNAPRERQALVLANSRAKAAKEANDDMPKSEYKKLKARELGRARAEVGSNAKEARIVVTDREWEAIQSGAVSSTLLERVLDYSDPDTLRQRATPRATAELSSAKKSKIRTMYSSSNYTLAEIAEALGVSTTTVSNVIKGE